MNKTRFLTIAVVFLLLLNATTLYFLFAKKTGKRPSHGGNRPYSEFISKQLKFDEQQNIQLKQLRDQHKLELDTLKKEDKQLHEVLFSFAKTGITDSMRIDSVTSLIGANKKQFELTFLKHFSQIRSICRPDQLELYNQTLDQMMKRRMPSPGDRDKRPDPPPGN